MRGNLFTVRTSASSSHDLFPLHVCMVYLTSEGSDLKVKAYFSVRSHSSDRLRHLLSPRFLSSSWIPPPPAHLPFSASLHYQCLFLRSCLLSFFLFSFVCFVLFLASPPSTTAAPLNCPTSNSTAVQVDIFPMFPLHPRTCALTNRSREAEWSSCRGD